MNKKNRLLTALLFVSSLISARSASAEQRSAADVFDLRSSIFKTHAFRESAAGLSSHHDLLKENRAPSAHLHDVTFIVKDRNMDELTRILHEISDPTHPTYGNHLTSQEIADLTSNPKARDEVVTFLKAAGVTMISETLHGECITARAEVNVWERMFDTEFHMYSLRSESAKCRDLEGKNDLSMFIIAEKYSVPSALDEHIASVMNVIEIPETRSERRRSPIKMRSNPARSSRFSNQGVIVDSYVTPALLKQVYNVDDDSGHPRATQAAFEGFGQKYSPEDTASFQDFFGEPIQAVNKSIGDMSVTAAYCVSAGLDICAESNLDIQYLSAMSHSPTINYYTGSTGWSQWLLDLINSGNPPLVLTISYGFDEVYVNKGTFDFFNTNAIKIGAMGVTIFVASGDDGVLSPLARSGDPKYCKYAADFPAASPYVTSVGGTQGIENGLAETVCQNDRGGSITSGGGFSTYYPQPAWQSSAVDTYFNTVDGTSKEPYTGFNRSMRGYPDVSFAASQYLFFVGGIILGTGGTSVSSPVFAGMVTNVNAARLKYGGSSVGFINPILYAYASSFANDVTFGKNNCSNGGGCCAQGFSATAGWDPASGLGSMDMRKFTYFMLDIVGIVYPTSSPTLAPTSDPTASPEPSASPTCAPSMLPTVSPSASPSLMPTYSPSEMPTLVPTDVPSDSPTISPSSIPTANPTNTPSLNPTSAPSSSPSVKPSLPPSTRPSASPSANPTAVPSSLPTKVPSTSPSLKPVISSPSSSPTARPTAVPSTKPTVVPSAKPIPFPTVKPTVTPTAKPTVVPTAKPTANPSKKPIFI